MPLRNVTWSSGALLTRCCSANGVYVATALLQQGPDVCEWTFPTSTVVINVTMIPESGKSVAPFHFLNKFNIVWGDIPDNLGTQK